jgi:hypothetical protein
MSDILAALAGEYPQLYLNPDSDAQETYRHVVLRGEEPETTRLDHYRGSEFDRMETVDTPAGPVRVVTLGGRRDFEIAVRGLMAAKNGPLAPIPESQGTAMLTVFNWPRIRAHLAAFPEEEQAAEYKRFTSVKVNYTDMLVVLSRGPYSGVSASAMWLTEGEWLARSDTIRRYHELTHVICRRLYQEDVDPVRDELEAVAGGGKGGSQANDGISCSKTQQANCSREEKRSIYLGAFPNCAATVEDGSWCSTNDACVKVSVNYQGMTDCGKAWR